MRLAQWWGKYLDHRQDQTVTNSCVVNVDKSVSFLTSFTIDENTSEVLYSHPSAHFSIGQDVFGANVDSL